MPSIILSLCDNFKDLLLVEGLRLFSNEFGVNFQSPQTTSQGETVSVPIFSSHPSYPNNVPRNVAASKARPLVTDPHRLQEAQRDKAVQVLRRVMEECNENGDPKELEAKIYDESNGDTQEYVAILCHERIRIRSKNNCPLTSSEALIGKRKRPTLEAHLNPERVSARVPIRWKFEKHTNNKFLNDSILLVPLSPYVADELEQRFRSRSDPFSMKLEEDGPEYEIDVLKMTATSSEVHGSLTRELIVNNITEESPLTDLPPHWEPQDTVFHREYLEQDNPLYQQIAAEIHKTLPDANIRKIIQLQHINQRWSYVYRRNLLEVTHCGKELMERFLFYGSWTMSPELLQHDSRGLSVHVPDPDPNDNWGKAIHLSSSAWYAHERAFTYRDTVTNQLHHQIFFVHTMVGLPVDLPSDPTLRHAPKQTEVNNMKVYYDSVRGKYTKGDKTAKVFAVYNPDQTCPQFLIDYTMP